MHYRVAEFYYLDTIARVCAAARSLSATFLSLPAKARR
jgi:hypothetical protein